MPSVIETKVKISLTDAMTGPLAEIVKQSQKAKKSLEDIGGASREVKSASDVLNQAMNAAKGLAAVKVGEAIVSFGADCIKASMETTKLKSSLEVLTGSAERGQKTYAEFAEFAAATPFNTNEVIKYGKQMIAMGYDVNEVTKYLRVFGDTAAATGSDLGSITLVMGQIKNSTRLSLQDINQLQNNGVNVWQMLSKASGKSMAEMKEAVHDGTVSGAQAFEMLSNEMQKTFGGMMDKQSQTLQGALNELGEVVDAQKSKFGEWLSETLNLREGIKSLTNGLKDLVGAAEAQRKADTGLTNEEAAIKKAIDDTKYVLEELTDDYYAGRIGLQEYTKKTESINEGCQIAQNGLNNMGIAVTDLQALMNKGIITAGQYAQAIASISYNAAQLRIAQEGLTTAIKSGDVNAQQGYLNRIEAINAASRTLANTSLNEDLMSGEALKKDGPEAAVTTKKGDTSAQKAIAKAEKDYTRAMGKVNEKKAELAQKILEDTGTFSQIEQAKMKQELAKMQSVIDEAKNSLKNITDEDKIASGKKGIEELTWAMEKFKEVREKTIEREAEIKDSDNTIEELNALRGIGTYTNAEIDALLADEYAARKKMLSNILQDTSLTTEQRIAIEKKYSDAVKGYNEATTNDYKSAWEQTLEYIKNKQFNVTDTLKQGIDNVLNDIINVGQNILTESKSFSDRIRDMFRNMANDIFNTFTKIIMQKMLMKVFSGISLAADGGYIGAKAYASGGNASGWALVGERGPELVNFDQPGRVYNAEQTARALSGSSPTDVKVVIENRTNQQVKATNATAKFDGKSLILGVVIDAVRTNDGGFNNLLKGAIANG